MNRAKARDFYSDYYEGTLDRGLTQMFERALKEDGSLREDYDQFCELMGSLDTLKDIEVPEPAFLHERIEKRMNEKSAQTVAKPAFWWLTWGKWAFAGATALAALALVINMTAQPSKSPNSVANLVPEISISAEVPPKLALDDKGLTLLFKPGSDARVTFQAMDSASGPKEFNLDAGQELRSPVHNESESAELVEITFSTSHDRLMVAVPGTKIVPQRNGSGTVKDLALALANTFGRPVQLATDKPAQRLVWDFKAGDEVDAVSQTLRQFELSLESRADGILFLN